MSLASDALRCYDADLPYTPQNRFGTPQGFRDEDYFIPFSLPLENTDAGQLLTNLVRNFPIQMDDDAPFIWLAIIFPAAGLTKATIVSVPSSGVPAFLAWRDTRGNPLSDGLVLTMGAWCQSGFGTNGAGFPLDEPVECDAGGCLTVDYQVAVGAGIGTHASVSGTGTDETLTLTAVVAGVAGNGIRVFINVAGINQPLTIDVSVEPKITINLATDGAGTATSTFADVLAALAASPEASALVTASITGTNPAEVVGDIFGELGSFTSGGVDALPLPGVLYGKKRYPLCVGAE